MAEVADIDLLAWLTETQAMDPSSSAAVQRAQARVEQWIKDGTIAKEDAHRNRINDPQDDVIRNGGLSSESRE